MKLYRATENGVTVSLSPEPIRADDFSFPIDAIDEVEREVPVVDGVIRLWNGCDGGKYPHLHYVCPRCGVEHNVDLYPDDPSPRFGCCDSCGWESVVWVRWKRIHGQ